MILEIQKVKKPTQKRPPKIPKTEIVDIFKKIKKIDPA